MSDGVIKLPAFGLEKMEQKNPGAFSTCTVLPCHVEATYLDDPVIGVRWGLHLPCFVRVMMWTS